MLTGMSTALADKFKGKCDVMVDTASILPLGELEFNWIKMMNFCYQQKLLMPKVMMTYFMPCENFNHMHLPKNVVMMEYQSNISFFYSSSTQCSFFCVPHILWFGPKYTPLPAIVSFQDLGTLLSTFNESVKKSQCWENHSNDFSHTILKKVIIQLDAQLCRNFFNADESNLLCEKRKYFVHDFSQDAFYAIFPTNELDAD